MRLSLSSFVHQSCLFSFAALSTLMLATSILRAAPLQLQATSVAESQTYCNTFSIAGANFSFADGVGADCSGPFLAYYGESLTSSVTLISPQPYFLQGPAYGMVNVPENPGRYAMLTGNIEAYGPNTPPIPFGSVGDFQFDNTVPLIGSFSVCLLPAGGFPIVLPVSSPACDPNYLNFATINVSIVGTDVFDFPFCLPQGDVCTYTENFTGTAPEPNTLALVTFSGLISAFLFFLRKSQAQEYLLNRGVFKVPSPSTHC